MQQMKVQQQQSMHQANPHLEKLNLEKSKLAAQVQQEQIHNAHKAIELGLNKETIATERIKLLAEQEMAHKQNLVQLEKVQTERLARAIDCVLKSQR